MVAAKIARLRDPNFLGWRSVGGGVLELRIFMGPGYRVYFGLSGSALVLLLGGGEKGTQKRDIEKAKRLWRQSKHAIQGVFRELYITRSSRP